VDCFVERFEPSGNGNFIGTLHSQDSLPRMTWMKTLNPNHKSSYFLNETYKETFKLDKPKCLG
jgi:hypothetical protein